jgi:hypothetical protein
VPRGDIEGFGAVGHPTLMMRGPLREGKCSRGSRLARSELAGQDVEAPYVAQGRYFLQQSLLVFQLFP